MQMLLNVIFHPLVLQVQSTPVPRDIPLPLPLPEWLLVIVLVISFLAHIVFVNLMLGGSILTLWAQIKGLKNKEYDTLAHEIAATITVNKSMAVVLGVAPLLSINTLYTVYFYSANALTGFMWILIIPLVTVAFLLTYLHKYTWHALQHHRGLHISIMALAVLLFLFIPLIFLTNVNLMQFPERWGTIKGFTSALALPNVFPRYLHFLCASLAVSGLFVFWYIGSRKRYPFERHFTLLTRYDVKKMGYTLALGASAAQFMIGPLVLITLPSKGVGLNLIAVILVGAAVAVPAVWWMWKGLTGPAEQIGKHFRGVVILLGITVVFMGSGRQVYRANALDPHRKLMAAKTAEHLRLAKEAREQATMAPPGESAALDGANAPGVTAGKATFRTHCAACHAEKRKLVGPPVTEMVEIYAADPTALKAWIKTPGKKRADAPQMPGFPQLSADQLEELSQYILSVNE